MTNTNRRRRFPLRNGTALAALLALCGCSVRASATRLAADALAGESSVYASDDDPELVRDAVPFGLKAMEGLLLREPQHVPLLTALASGFAQYTYAFVQQDADAAELEGHPSEARAIRERARRLYLRGRDYGLRGLEVRHPGIGARLRSMRDLDRVVAALEPRDLPLLYWTAVGWALAIGCSKGDMALVAELPAPEALVQRGLQLDEKWNEGALHAFLVSFESVAPGGSIASARAHLERALQLSGGRRLGPLVAWAEGPLVQEQNRPEFVRVLTQVIDYDVDRSPPDRLANRIAQRRARLLLAHADDLFSN